MSAGWGAGALAAIIAARRRSIIRRFRAAGAHTVDSARTLAEIGIHRSLLLNMMARRRVLVRLADDRWWLDETAERADRRRRLLILAIILSLVAIGIFVLSGLLDPGGTDA